MADGDEGVNAENRKREAVLMDEHISHEAMAV
jgi:hypothetical protein